MMDGDNDDDDDNDYDDNEHGARFFICVDLISSSYELERWSLVAKLCTKKQNISIVFD